MHAPVNIVPGKAPSFLQASRAGLKGKGKLAAAALLREEGIRLKSTMLASLVAQVAADPFAKVKVLIQQLIERLLAEAEQEATKKSFCETEIGKAKLTRDRRSEEIFQLDAEIGNLQTTQEELEEKVDELTEEIPKKHQTLNETTNLRASEKVENLKNIKTAKEGLAAVTEAITILKAFYKSAAAKPSLIQASPVDEDTSGPDYEEGPYRGKQEDARGVIAILEVVKSDFERTIRQTEGSEKEAAADFVDFDRMSRTDISSKETDQELSSQELQLTKDRINTKLEDLADKQNLLDAALKTIQDLKPMCIDTAMSYKERKQKRQEEIEALKKALCLLDDQDNPKEAECR